MIEDTIETIRRFKNSARNREAARAKAAKDREKRRLFRQTIGLHPDSSDDEASLGSITIAAAMEDKPTGLKTGLRAPTLGETGKAGSPELEALLNRFESELMSMAFNYKPDQGEPEISKQIRALQQEMATDANAYTVIVPTDKTNSFTAMDLEEYRRQMIEHRQCRRQQKNYWKKRGAFSKTKWPARRRVVVVRRSAIWTI